MISTPAGVLLDFSISFLGRDSKAVIADPAYGASLVDISDTFVVTVSKKITVAGEKAICWSAYSERFDSIFLMDGGVTNITILDSATGAITGSITQSAAGAGSLDAAVDRTFLYVLKGAALVSVSDLTGLEGNKKIPKQIQSFDLSALGSRPGVSGNGYLSFFLKVGSERI